MKIGANYTFPATRRPFDYMVTTTGYWSIILNADTSGLIAIVIIT